MYFNWEREYETGIEKIDFQHKKLVEMINHLYDELIIKENPEYVNELLVDLKIYTISHFVTEEKMFTKYNYKGEDLEQHIKKHEQFKNKIGDFLGDLNMSDMEIAYNLLEYLKNWLAQHILNTDMKYASYLKQNYSTEIADENINFNKKK